MAITDKELEEIRKYLDSSKKPIIFYDDDQDGLCSFYQFYKTDARGIILKSKSELTEEFARKVDEFDPDMVFIVDIPKVSQEFVDRVKQKIIYIDHHEPNPPKGVTYYNPRLHDDKDNRPISYWTYKVTEKSLWVAMAGCIGDWFLPDFKDDFIKEYPELLSKDIVTPDDALFDSKIGLLSMILAMNLKGDTKDCINSVRRFLQVKEPEEILKGTTKEGKYLLNRYKIHEEVYSELKKFIKPQEDDPLLVFSYPDSTTSYTSELSNEALHRFPDKIIIIARYNNEEYKVSLRSATIPIAPILEKVLLEVEGFGGGHRMACGANIKEKDWKRFIELFRDEVCRLK